MNKNKIHTLIIDDESLARLRISKLLKEDKDIVVIGEAENGIIAVEKLNQLKPDLIFLDVQMPELNGFEVIEQLDENYNPVVIFVTAYDKYALKAFEIHAIDYLLKPFEDERFYSALEFAKEKINKNEGSFLNDKILSLLSDKNISEKKYLERIVVKSSGRIYFVKVDDIIRIKSNGKYLEIRTKDTTHSIRKTMNEIETQLDPDVFIRIHRSTIIKIESISEIQHWYKNEYIFKLINKEEFTSGGSFRGNLDKVLK